MVKAKQSTCRNCMRAIYQLSGMKHVWFHEFSSYVRCYPKDEGDLRVAEPPRASG